MTKKYLYTALLSFVLISCQTEESPEISEKTYPVCFSLQLNKTVLPFPGTRTMPPMDVEEPTVSKSGTDNELADLCNQIEYIVYKDAELSQPFKQTHYSDSDEDYGIIYDRLPVGTYKVVFLSHSSATATLNGTTLSFDSLSDTFHAVMDYEVTSTEGAEENITLHRIVSRIEFESSEPVPDTQQSFSMEINPYSNKVNVLTGAGIPSESPQTITHIFTDDELGTEGMKHGFYTFVAPDPSSFGVTLTATNKENAVTRTYTLAVVTPVKNKIVRYTGALYSTPSSNDSFFIDIFNNGAWDEGIENTL